MKPALLIALATIISFSVYGAQNNNKNSPAVTAYSQRLESARQPVEIKINDKVFYVYIGEKEGILEALRTVGISEATGNDANKIADLGKTIARSKVLGRLVVAEKPKH